MRKHAAQRWVGSLAFSSLAVSTGLVFALAGTGVSDALWNTRADIPGLQVASGTTGLGIALGEATGSPADAVAFPENTWANSLPGDVKCASVTLTNSGDVPLRISVSAAGLNPSLATLELRSGACGAPVGDPMVPGAEASVLTNSLAANSSATFGVTVRVNDAVTNSLQGTPLVPGFQITVAGETVPSRG